MKNQYFADENDYLKYGLLRILSGGGGIMTAVCWMLTNGDRGTDGKLTNYLAQENKWRPYDPPLFDSLAECVRKLSNRSIRWAEARTIIPSANYFGEILDDSRTARTRYFESFMDQAIGHDLVFFDPDNGVEVPSRPLGLQGRKGSCKYIYWFELIVQRDFQVLRDLRPF